MRGYYPTQEVIRRMQWLKPAASFRSRYAYQNVQYAMAGEVVRAIANHRVDSLVAAGSVWWSVSDMAKRMRFVLLDHAEPHHALMLRVFDMYAVRSPRDWSSELLTFVLDAQGNLVALHPEIGDDVEFRRVSARDA